MFLKLIPMKRILIPTDFSHNAWNAIEYTLAFFDKIPVDIHLLHISYSGSVTDEANLHANGISIIDNSQKKKVKQLKEIQHKIETLYPRSTANIEISAISSLFIEGIKNAVEENKMI